MSILHNLFFSQKLSIPFFSFFPLLTTKKRSCDQQPLFYKYRFSAGAAATGNTVDDHIETNQKQDAAHKDQVHLGA